MVFCRITTSTYFRFSRCIYKYSVSGRTFHYFWMRAFPTPYWAKCCKSSNSVQVSAVKPCNLLSSASDLKVFNPRFCRFLILRLYSSLQAFPGTMASVSPRETRECCGSGGMPFYWKQTAGCTCQLRPRWTESMLHIWTSHFIHLAFQTNSAFRASSGRPTSL